MTQRTDTERLEWLEKRARTCTVYMDGTELFSLFGKTIRGASFRAAIDAAMESEERR